MGLTRKQTIRRINGLSKKIDEHLAKIQQQLHSVSAAHWRTEVETWIV